MIDWNRRQHDKSAVADGVNNVAVSEGEEVMDGGFALDDFEEESLHNFMQNTGKTANCRNTYNGRISVNGSNIRSRKRRNTSSLRADSLGVVDETPNHFRDSVRRRRLRNANLDIRRAHEVQEVERAIARASGSIEQTPAQQQMFVIDFTCIT
ncbi:unnamed protein product [Gongylonema pulchrum]|uniref:BZIP domain-containing protein n=1 Tax=Gongylonema pulchrum TaxID=637853 RepID=A0A183DH74_9BILA|nr:unnamed protein product [Gongylonema pulchrum]